jgi:hypothetical protein
MSRGARLLWAVPAVFAVQQIILALPGDDVSLGASPLFSFLVIAVLAWDAAARRSRLAWGVLVVLAVAMVLLPAAIMGGYDAASSAFLILGLLIIGLLLWPASLAHVWSRA